MACWAFTVRLFHSLHLAGLPGAVCIALSEGGCYCPQRTRCLRTGCWRCDTSPLAGLRWPVRSRGGVPGAQRAAFRERVSPAKVVPFVALLSALAAPGQLFSGLNTRQSLSKCGINFVSRSSMLEERAMVSLYCLVKI